jgi:hypothetical protein
LVTASAVAPPLYLPGGGDTDRVGIELELEHHLRVIGRGPCGLDVGVVDQREINELVDDF